MRIVKEANERKNEILDVAEELFATKGYDATSTNDILARIKIARGTLYYHFPSKESILDAIIERMSNRLMATAKSVAGNKDIPVVERIAKSVMSLNIESDIAVEVMEQVHKPQNALMHQKMQEGLLKGIVPIISDLVREGIKEGIFATEYPEQTTEMLMIYSSVAFDTANAQTDDQMMARVKGFIYNIERLLNAAPGSMTESMMKIFM